MFIELIVNYYHIVIEIIKYYTKLYIHNKSKQFNEYKHKPQAYKNINSSSIIMY